MSPDIPAAAVRQFRCFTELTPWEAASLSAALDLVRLRPGQALFAEGDAGDALFLLVSGRVSIRIAIPGQAARELCILEPGAAFGEISLLLGAGRTAAAVA